MKRGNVKYVGNVPNVGNGPNVGNEVIAWVLGGISAFGVWEGELM
jgi:hypothetical protein